MNPYADVFGMAAMAFLVIVVIGLGTTLVYFNDKRRSVPVRAKAQSRRRPG